MARATRRGWLGTTNNNSSSVPVNVTSDSTAPVMGDWMIVTVVTTNTATTISSPGSQWTTLVPTTAMGTRYFAVFGARRGAETGGYTFTTNANATTQAAMAWGPGGVVSPSGWIVGLSLIHI